MQLRLRHDITVGLDLRGILPGRLLAMSAAEVPRVTVQAGNRRVELGELFDIDTGPGRHEGLLRLIGDFSKADYLAAELDEGTVFVQGRVGNRAAQGMTGGTLVIHGHVGTNLAEGMRGGWIKVIGNVGDRLGCPLPGERRGLQGGQVFIQGNAGREVGNRMRRGMIAVAGDCGDFAGYEMLAGTIVVGGRAGANAGLMMRRGTLVLNGNRPEQLLPGFARACRFQPPMMPLLGRELVEFGWNDLGQTISQSSYDLFHGDLTQLGRGEIFLPAA